MDFLAFTIIVFILTASGGIFMLAKVLSDRRPPRSVVYIHGILAAAAYGLVVYYSFGTNNGFMEATTIFLTVALLVGLTLFGIDLFKKRIPKVGAVIHGTAAIAGIILLIIYALSD